MSDPASLATLDVLTKLAPPALYTDANLLSLVICRVVNLSLEHGNSDGSCFAYVLLGMIAGPRFGDYQAGFRFGQLGYDLVEQRGLKRFQARTYMNFGSFVMPWTRHVRAGRDLVRRAFEAANQSGDLTFAAYCCANLNTNLLAAGDPLAEVQREAEHGLEFAQKMRFGLVIDIITAQLGLIRTLRGLTPKFGSFDDEQFDELRFEHHLASNPDLALAECWYWIRKLQARFFAGDYAAAIEASSKAQRLLWTSPSHVRNGRVSLLRRACSRGILRFAHLPTSGSSISRLWPPTTDSSRSGRRIARRISRTAPRWSAPRSPGSKAASSMPSTFTNRPSARPAQTALSTTRRSPTSWPRASTRRAASSRSRTLYLRDARDCYLRWGADGKVRQLDAAVSAPQEWKSPRPLRRARSRRRSNISTSRP